MSLGWIGLKCAFYILPAKHNHFIGCQYRFEQQVTVDYPHGEFDKIIWFYVASDKIHPCFWPKINVENHQKMS